jgi:MFS superfamily sulfate permease-like transporter
MPSPKFPPIGSVFIMLIGDAFNIAIVSFALNVSLVKYFSHKHDYEVNSNQELLSYGVGNLACSFFSGFPACSGLTRSLIVEGIGARTQVYSLISSLIVLAAFLGIGFLFKELPNACLASIIVVSLIHKCMEVSSVIGIFRKSKIEAMAWCATFCGVIILDIDYGLYIGLSCSLLLIIFQTQRPPATLLANIQQTELYEDIKYCPEAKEINGIKMIRYEANIYYANVENFIYQIIKLSSVKPREIICLIEKKKNSSEKLIKKIKLKKIKKNKLEMRQQQQQQQNGVMLSGDEQEEEQTKKNLEIELDAILNCIPIKDLILDLSCINFIDSMGSEAILRLNQMFKKIGIQLHLTHIKGNIFRDLKRYSFIDKFDYRFIYPTNHDAVCTILNQKSATQITTTTTTIQNEMLNVEDNCCSIAIDLK